MRTLYRKISCGIATVVLIGSFRPISASDCASADATSLKNQLVARLEWEAYWRHIPSTSVKRAKEMNLFWSSMLRGYCSIELGECAAYSTSLLVPLGQLFRSRSLLQSGGLEEATREFLDSLTRSADTVTRSDAREKLTPDRERTFAGGGGSYRIPELRDRPVPQTTGFQICRQGGTVQISQLPDAIRSKRVPSDYFQLREMIAQMARNARGAVLIVPFYSPTDPEINILVQKPGELNSIMFLVHDDYYGGWKIGGHLDEHEAGSVVRRLSQRILAARMTSVP